jgi:acyl carrier protein
MKGREVTATGMESLHKTIVTLLAENGHTDPISDHDSLFISGRLDSLSAAEVMALLERDYGIDLADPDFDIAQLDTFAKIKALVRQEAQ